jgi:hypothetical protein
MQGDKRVLRALADYCKGDVLALEELYNALRPFDNAHPRLIEDPRLCGVCASELKPRGFAFTKDYKYQRYRCSGCGKWSRGNKRTK